ncbi:hypothetical protein KQI68_07885 [Peptoniphilus sp. MSJ-1]|uniref:DUF2262 domain-containing protein n=1 Tax=Peptoniphilus ovalis TaxID=2841503 RepID=A0ABS6FI69_9FIRM|nr:hypothetical protein [Peptoniphilus ovalis]MBU5669753.1 hypothetical protein [Peptoniphilus ovalis]
MRVKPFNSVFSFHDCRIENIEEEKSKITLYFDDGYTFKENNEGQADYAMTNPRLVFHLDESIEYPSSEELNEIITGIIKEFDEDFEDLDFPTEEFEVSNITIKLFEENTYKKITLKEFLEYDFEVINESFGYCYARFSGIVTKWDKDFSADASIEIFYNNDLELIYDDLVELEKQEDL